jgi:hypothetical protein
MNTYPSIHYPKLNPSIHYPKLHVNPKPLSFSNDGTEKCDSRVDPLPGAPPRFKKCLHIFKTYVHYLNTPYT